MTPFPEIIYTKPWFGNSAPTRLAYGPHNSRRAVRLFKSQAPCNLLNRFSNATLFIINSLILVSLSRIEIRETQSVLEKQEEQDTNLPQIPNSN